MSELLHYGIKGQHWGVKHGPPYPLSGDDYTRDMKAQNPRLYKNKYSLESRKFNDFDVKSGTDFQTLSRDKDRTKNTDMFFAAYETLDKIRYNGQFNTPLVSKITDPDTGKDIVVDKFYKWTINNKNTKDIKVASEKSQQDAFLKLFKDSKSFSSYIKEPNGLEKDFSKNRLKFASYRKAMSALERIRKSEIPKESDLRIAFRLFNYAIPSEGRSMELQRTRFFNELKKSGYSACLDVNDSMYGGYHALRPVIVFDTSSFVTTSIKESSESSVRRDKKLVPGIYSVSTLVGQLNV